MRRLFALALLSGLIGGLAAQESTKDDSAKPKAEPEKKVEPEKKAEETDVQQTADRIADNATKAGERLKDKDLGKDTRVLQDQILKDIDALIKKSPNPPPPPKSDNPPPMPPMNSPPPMGGTPPPMGGTPPPMGGTPPPMPKNGMNPGGMPPPKKDGMGGGQPEPKKDGTGAGQPEPKKEGARPGRRPRPNREPMGNEPAVKEPMGPMAKAEPKESKEPGGMPPTPLGQPPKKNARPEQFAEMYKDVWGKLPDRLRQEMDLYYREQFMPRYGELLRQYYSSIAEQKKRGPGDK